MYGPSDRYGDMDLEDIDEFEGLEPEDGRMVEPEGRFERGEVRSFERDFEDELDEAEEDEYWRDRQEFDDEDDDWDDEHDEDYDIEIDEDFPR